MIFDLDSLFQSIFSLHVLLSFMSEKDFYYLKGFTLYLIIMITHRNVPALGLHVYRVEVSLGWQIGDPFLRVGCTRIIRNRVPQTNIA